MDVASTNYKLHVASAALFALQTQVTDGVIWSLSFRRMMGVRGGGGGGGGKGSESSSLKGGGVEGGRGEALVER